MFPSRTTSKLTSTSVAGSATWKERRLTGAGISNTCSRREIIRILGAAAAGLSVGACSSRRARPLSQAEAKRAVARAIYGAELARQGERLIERARLDEDEKEELGSLMRLARAGEELDRSAIEDHSEVVKRLLRELWSDDELLWRACGYPNGPGVCTELDLYTRPPVEARRSGKRSKRG